jgi:hypothetical protein
VRRLAIGAGLSVLVLAMPAPARVPPTYWTVGKVMRHLDNTRIALKARSIRVETESTLCSGEGAAIRRQGVRMWRRFVCTFTTFDRQGVDRDLDFRVRVTGTTRFVVLDPHWVGEGR